MYDMIPQNNNESWKPNCNPKKETVFLSKKMAACLLAITPIVIMYIFLQKYFTEGIARAGLAN